MDPHCFWKLDPYQSQNSGAFEAQNGAVDAQNRGVQAQNGGLEAQNGAVDAQSESPKGLYCRPKVTDSHHLDEEQDPDPH
jgi:hypothetical protein